MDKIIVNGNKSKRLYELAKKLLDLSIKQIKCIINFNKEISIKIIVITRKKFIKSLDENFNNYAIMFMEDGNIYINQDSFKNFDLEFCKILHHEIIHAILYNINKNIDLWLSEGLATLLARNIIKDKVNKRNIIPLNKLKKYFKFNIDYYYSAMLYIKYLYVTQKEILKELILSNMDVKITKKELVSFLLTNNI